MMVVNPLIGRFGRAFIAGLILALVQGPASAQISDLEETRKQASDLYLQGRFKDALPLAERVVAELEKQHGPNHIEVGSAFNSLGLIRWRLGHHPEAEFLLQARDRHCRSCRNQGLDARRPTEQSRSQSHWSGALR